MTTNVTMFKVIPAATLEYAPPVEEDAVWTGVDDTPAAE